MRRKIEKSEVERLRIFIEAAKGEEKCMD